MIGVAYETSNFLSKNIRDNIDLNGCISQQNQKNLFHEDTEGKEAVDI